MVDRALVFAAALAAAAFAAPVHAQGVLGGLAGTWSGGGQIRLSDGTSERISCRAFYSPREGGAGLGLAIRCASQSYKIELRSSLQVAGGHVSGNWEERSFNAGGSLSGSAAPGSLRVAFNGSTTGSMSITYAGSSQRVSISTSGGGLSGVSLNLSKG